MQYKLNTKQARKMVATVLAERMLVFGTVGLTKCKKIWRMLQTNATCALE